MESRNDGKIANSPRRHLLLFLSALAAFAGAFCIVGYLYKPDKTEQEKLDELYQKNTIECERQIEREHKAIVAKTVDAFLEEQRRGNRGSDYWDKILYAEPPRFYAVRSWEIVSGTWDTPVVVRIDSSTRGGIPITQLWEFHLSVDDKHIYCIEERIKD